MAPGPLTADPYWAGLYATYCDGRLDDPYPLFAWLLAQHPAHWSDPLQGWFICRHADVQQGLLDPRLSSARAAVNMRPLPPDLQLRFQGLGEHLSYWLGFIDPPRHTEIRRLLARIFTPKLAQSLEELVQRTTDDLLAQMPDTRVDLVDALAHPLPLTVICEILGIPPADRGRFRQAVIDVSDFVAEAGPNAVRAAERAYAGVQEMSAYFARLVEQRRREPRADVVSLLANAATTALDLSVSEILGLCVFLFSAGHDTTTSLIGSAALALLQHPAALAQVRRDPSLLPSAVEEVLRFECPIPLISRLASEDMDFAGCPVRRGDAVFFCVAAANRDQTVFEAPDEVRIERTPNRHLSFGWGAHFCLGAPLARTEARIALAGLVERLARSQLEEARPAWHPRLGLRALRALWIGPARP
jgi:cytochrome P450